MTPAQRQSLFEEYKRMADAPDYVNRDTAFARAAACEQENAELRSVLGSLVDAPLRYSGPCIEIDCGTHTNAMERVAKARKLLAKVRT